MTYDEYLQRSRSTDKVVRSEAHREYYGQFVTEALQSGVVRSIGAEVIRRSTDPHMSDIPLKKWDDLDGWIRSATRRVAAAPPWSLSDSVCVAKEAARQFKEAD